MKQWAIQQPAALTYEHLGVQLCSMRKKFMCFMTLMNLWVAIQLWKLSGYTRSHTLQSLSLLMMRVFPTPLSTHTPFTTLAEPSACWWIFSHCNESLATIHKWSWLLPLGRGKLFVLHKTRIPFLIRSYVHNDLFLECQVPHSPPSISSYLVCCYRNTCHGYKYHHLPAGN